MDSVSFCHHAVRCPLRDHIVTEMTWHRGFPVAGPDGRS
jgi:hypothetical protein